ncbi:MAG: hypothetical protein WD016_04550 [Balneolaceae bacterium]
MGWFTGVFGKNLSLRNKISELHPEPLFTVDDDFLYLTGGGISDTLYFSEQENDGGWLASGIGISTDEQPQFFSTDLWAESISKGADYLHQQNGHFAVARWNPEELELITDQLGMRNIFIHQGEDCVVFSTRLDLLMKLVPASINWKKFGSRWLAINQFSSGSFMDGIQRLSQGGRALISSEKVTISNQRWNYNRQKSSPEQFKSSLFQFSSIALKANKTLSLGLSGGLDSRTLFASLLSEPEANWRLHSFGEKDHPDLQTAQLLNGPFGRQHHVFHQEIPPAQTLIDMLPDFAGQSLFTAAPPHLISLQAYQKIAALNLSVVDGGFGEIARRRFLVSLLLRGKKSLLNKNTNEIIPYLLLPRADIFTAECNAEMMQGFREELSAEIEAMPSISETGLETWLDLFSIRTRVPNGAGPEQSRSDSLLFNYMPFLQPQLIEQALNLPLNQRKNARLFRKIISDKAPQLQQVKLVKGQVTYPYWMKDFNSAVWMRVKQKAGKSYHSSQQIDFLLVLEEYVRDLFSSASAKNYPAYDQQKITNIITGFYDEKNFHLATELNWLLAFEVFRDG